MSLNFSSSENTDLQNNNELLINFFVSIVFQFENVSLRLLKTVLLYGSVIGIMCYK